MRLLRSALLVSALAIYSSPVHAAPILIDFESLSDLEDVTGQFSADGILFTGATALVAGAVGGSLNEIDFPPSSGNTVIYDSGGGIQIDFLNGISSFSGLFTYATSVTLTAFSEATVLGTVTSLLGSNLGTNELLQFAFAGGITRITLVGDLNGGSFTMDDLTVNTLDMQPVPEPGTVSLLLLGVSVLAARGKVRGRRVGRASH